jgi:methylated-DNA-[protein]-cysteine S-methyltransferase
MSSLFETSVASSLGTMRILWRETPSGPMVTRIMLPRERRMKENGFSGEVLPSISHYPAIEQLTHTLQSFLAGQDVEFDLRVLDFSKCREFQRKVLRAEFAVPRGYVTTYGRIAGHLGIARGARAVGRALSTNPFPLVIPCHRTIRLNGELGGFRGGVRMKRSLLRMEGVRFRANGRVVLEKVYY